MYYTVTNKETIEYLNEYLLTKKYDLYKLNHDELDRLYHYYEEKIYLLISKNIYNLPNVRRYYYWFEDNNMLNLFIQRVKQTTIKKYRQNYFNLYKDFEKKYNHFKLHSKYFKELENKSIEELKSLTFTYYDLKKYTNIFKHKYENLDKFDSCMFEKYELNINNLELNLINYPDPEQCIIKFKE
jgi:hypothetical protein